MRRDLLSNVAQDAYRRGRNERSIGPSECQVDLVVNEMAMVMMMLARTMTLAAFPGAFFKPGTKKKKGQLLHCARIGVLIDLYPLSNR